MDRLQAITAFVRVVEAGSFVGAAERLGVSVSAVSRQVALLETHLAARLIHRTTRRLSLTESGRAFYERSLQLLADLEEAEASAGASTIAPRGTLRLTAPVTFGERYLAPAIAAFIARYPEMRFDIDLSDRASDLVDEGFDAAVRIGAIGSQNLIGRRIGQSQMVCCAAPRYLERRGEPKRPGDLAAHDCLSYEYAMQRHVWVFRDRDGSILPIRVAGAAHANSGHLLSALAVDGAGIAYEPDFIVGPEIRAGRLRPILTTFRPPPSTIQVVYPSRRHLSAKVRAFADFLRDWFADADWTSEPVSPRRATAKRSPRRAERQPGLTDAKAA